MYTFIVICEICDALPANRSLIILYNFYILLIKFVKNKILLCIDDVF